MHTPAEGHQVPIDTATKAQLRAFANHIAAPVTNFMDQTKLIAALRKAGYEEAHIIVFDNAPTKAAEARAIASGAAVEEPVDELTVHTQEGAGGKRSVFVGCNGKALLIPRNVRCKVKHRYLGVLENAIETRYEFDDEAKANTPREVPSYPFQVHVPADPAKVKAYDEWYAAEESRLAATTKKAA